MGLDGPPQLGDRALGRLAEDLGEAEAGEGLDQSRRARDENDLRKKVRAALPDDIVQKNLGRSGQDEPAEAADEEQPEAESEVLS